jgi:hypothetical protein
LRRQTTRSTRPVALSKSWVAIRHDGSVSPQSREAIAEKGGRLIIEAGERLVEQHRARPMQQRTLERQPLAKASGESQTRDRRRARQPGGARASSIARSRSGIP